MTILTTQDYRDVLDLAYDVNRCDDMDSLIRTICPSMMRIFRSECVTFHLVEGCRWDIDIVESKSFKWDDKNLVEDKYYPALYKEGYYHRSPLLQDAVSSSKNMLKINESISQEDWERSEFYNDFMLPQHLFWEMFLPLRWKNNLKGMITLWRTRNQPDYESSDVEKGEILTPHLMLAIRNISKISRINHSQKQPAASHDVKDEGLIMLDGKLRPVYSSIRAREICLYLFNRMSLGAFDIERCEFPIPACIIQDCCDLLESQKARRVPALWPKDRVIFINNGRQFRIECSLVWKSDQITKVPQFMVTLSDLTGETRLEAGSPARLCLTRREMEIVHCLMADMSYTGIAEMLCISKLTVHTHVKNIYRKLGVRNKFELFRCVQSPTRPV
jgi:DNA-binding CsgD family transcriptional regulator